MQEAYVIFIAVKVLIIRFSSIGDIVLTTPVIRCLKKQLPDVEIHYLTKSSFKGLLEANPYITKLHLLGDEISTIVGSLKVEGFDLIVDLHKNLRTQYVKRKLGVKSVSFNKLNPEKWFMVNMKINRLPNVHIVDRYFEPVEYLGVKKDEEGLDHFIPPSEEIEISTLPESHQKGYVAFAIGGAHATKRLPRYKIIEICEQLGMPIVLLGGPEEVEAAGHIEHHLGGQVLNRVGQISVNGSASLIRQALSVITHDSGMMHIAAAFKKEIVSIWGNTIPEFGMYPYMPRLPHRNHIVQVKRLSCRPCSKIGFDNCPKKHFKCMERIDVAEVVRAASV